MADYPALMLWTDAYLGDAYHLSTEEHGAYFLMLMAAWRSPDCRLEDTEKFLSRVTKVTPKRWREKIRPALEPFWTIENGYWTQKRLTKEREKVKTICANRSRSGKASAAAKALRLINGGSTPVGTSVQHRARATPDPQPEDSLPSESYTESESYIRPTESCTYIVASGKKPKQPHRHNYTQDFEQFWKGFPKRPTDTKAGACKAWDKALATGTDPPTLQAGAERYAAFCQRTGHESMLVQTWINREGWTASYEGKGNGRGQDYIERIKGRLRQEGEDLFRAGGPVAEGGAEEWRRH
jgi:uncharacterized protein YdaU (DUF1376 family)